MTTKENKKSLTELQKWTISFWSALLFLLIASPFMFRLTSIPLSFLNLTTQQNGCPNLLGLVIHAIVFAVIIRLMMFIPV